MEYCEGNTLKQLIDRGILQEKPNMIWMLLREILDGLRHMHSKVFKINFFLDKFLQLYFYIGNNPSRFKTW
jgi:serine/threonine protein kinase